MNFLKKISKTINLGKFKVNDKSKTFIVAEISGNHEGKIKNVFKAIDLIKNSGADAIKIQSYEPNTITINERNKYFFINDESIWKGKYLYDLYKKSYTPFAWHKKIFDYAKKKKLICFSSPFDKSSVDLLESLDCPFYKIASPEIADLKLIDYVSKTKKPIIISTGIADDYDINLAINQCLKNKNKDIILLSCISSYPARDSEINIKNINNLKKKVPHVGFSDHTPDALAPVIAVSLDAKIIEKHFMISEKSISPDKTFSLSYNKFKIMINNIRRVEIQKGIENPNKKKIINKKLKTITRSLFYMKNLKKGSIIKKSDIESFRPGVGLSPQKYFLLIGKKIKRDVKKHTPVQKKDF